jgi:crotonobetainyl-CoA:carnitine CoA-transferase CaiB-like acyl-CoA transferase
MTGPLDGFRILDLTQVVMGPFASKILADFGADVIKIEPPTGDTSRAIPPMKSKGMGYVYIHANRNKRSVVLDLKQPEGLDAFVKLAETADGLICSVRPQAMDRLGLSYERLAALNPKLVYLNLVGFGEGPYANQPAYEDIFQALTGVSHMLTLTGAPHPMNVPLSYNDRMCGQSAVNIMLAALLGRERTGRGQHIIMPMFETMADFVLSCHMGGRTFDPNGQMGYQRILNDLRRPFPTKDSHISVVIYTDKHWRAFLDIAGCPEWFDEDPRLKTFTLRAENAAGIYGRVMEIMATKTTAEWLKAMQDADIPCAPVHTLEGMFEDPHIIQSGLLQRTEHPTEGTITELGIPSIWSDTQPELRRHAPTLGEQSQEILAEVGVTEDEYRRLVAAKVTR